MMFILHRKHAYGPSLPVTETMKTMKKREREVGSSERHYG
jgi:hypothetical protein